MNKKQIVLPLLAGIIFVFTGRARAEVNLEDREDDDREITLNSSRGQLIIRAGEPGMRFGREEDPVTQWIRLLPLTSGERQSGRIVRAVTLSGEASEKEIEVTFAMDDGDEAVGLVSLNDAGVLTLRPGTGLTGVRMEGKMDYGMVPGLFLEDVIHDPDQEAADTDFFLPPEELFAALLGDGDGILVCAWPEEDPADVREVRLIRNGPEIEAVEITLAGQELYAGLLISPGIWHVAELSGDCRNRDCPTGWQRPFAGRWRTELLAREVRSAMLIPEETERWWGFVVGWIDRGPVWFERDEAIFHLPGQFAPVDGRAFIYPLEGHAESLMGFLAETPMADFFAARRQRGRIHPWYTEHEAPYVGFPSCWGNDLLRRTLLKGGSQFREAERAFLNEWLACVIDASASTQDRRVEAAALLADLQNDIGHRKEIIDCPQARVFLARMSEIATNQTRNYADYIQGGAPLGGYGERGQEKPEDYLVEIKRLADRLRVIAAVPGAEFVSEYDDIARWLNTWAARDRDGRWGWNMREWFQEAGAKCQTSPEAARQAVMIRRPIRHYLSRRDQETVVRGGI